MALTPEVLSGGEGGTNDKCADQLAHPHSLISACGVWVSESLVPKLVTCEISIFYHVCVAVEAGVSLTVSEDRLDRDVAQVMLLLYATGPINACIVMV